MSAGHTKGPWSFDGALNNIIVWGAEPDIRVCFMTSDGPAKANARLIAAAPDLLEACQELIDVIDSVDGEAEYTKEEWAALGSAKLHAEDRIRAAIARATGEVA